MVEIWDRAVSLYDTRMYEEALTLFNFVKKHNPDDRVTGFYIARCESQINGEQQSA